MNEDKADRILGITRVMKFKKLDGVILHVEERWTADKLWAPTKALKKLINDAGDLKSVEIMRKQWQDAQG